MPVDRLLQRARIGICENPFANDEPLLHVVTCCTRCPCTGHAPATHVPNVHPQYSVTMAPIRCHSGPHALSLCSPYPVTVAPIPRHYGPHTDPGLPGGIRTRISPGNTPAVRSMFGAKRQALLTPFMNITERQVLSVSSSNTSLVQ